jgi:hypothetical protein
MILKIAPDINIPSLLLHQHYQETKPKIFTYLLADNLTPLSSDWLTMRRTPNAGAICLLAME